MTSSAGFTMFVFMNIQATLLYRKFEASKIIDLLQYNFTKRESFYTEFR